MKLELYDSENPSIQILRLRPVALSSGGIDIVAVNALGDRLSQAAICGFRIIDGVPILRVYSACRAPGIKNCIKVEYC